MHGHSFHADTECLLLPILCPDEVWRQPESIPDCARDQANETKPRLSCDQPRYVWYISAAIEVRTILEAPCFTIDFQAHFVGSWARSWSINSFVNIKSSIRGRNSSTRFAKIPLKIWTNGSCRSLPPLWVKSFAKLLAQSANRLRHRDPYRFKLRPAHVPLNIYSTIQSDGSSSNVSRP